MIRDDFGQNLLKMWAAKALEGESQIDEHIEWNIHTKAWMPVAQTVAMSIGMLMGMVGIWLMGMVVPDLVEQGHEQWALFLSGLGLVIGVPGALLAFRQANDLFDPLGKLSAMERLMKPYLARLFGLKEEEPEQALPRMFPVRNGGQVDAGYRAAARDLGANPADAELIEFVRLAEELGLAQDAWLGSDAEGGYRRYVLRSTGAAVTRPVWDRIMDELAEQWGFIDRGGNGRAARWLTEPEVALSILERRLEEMRAEHCPARARA